MSKSAQLTMQHGPFPDKIYTLSADQIIIGRAVACDIPIPDPEISRQHAQFVQQEPDAWTVDDLGSTNGTFVNGRRIAAPTALISGNRIDFGEGVRFQFDLIDEADQISDFIVAEMENYAPQSYETAPEPEAAVPPIAPEEAAAPPLLEDIIVNPEEKRGGCGRWFFGIGCGFLLLIFLCVALIFFLDAYDQGRLLYCGALRPFWAALLAPLGFSPVC